MSVWTEPKTNWSGAKNEYFNIQPDYQRIKGNIEYLGDYLGYIGFDKNNLYKMENVTLESVPKQTFFNNIVYNIDILRNFIGTPINYRNMRTYVSKGNVWNYQDLNIIEKNIFTIKGKMDSIFLAKDKLPFIQLGKGDEL